MKNPNGYGCIKHLSGSRRNPWAFVVTEGGKQKVKGYFPSKLEALTNMVIYCLEFLPFSAVFGPLGTLDSGWFLVVKYLRKAIIDFCS